MLLEKIRQARATASRGVARNRRVDDAIVVAARLELGREQIDPAFTGRETESGRNRIADDEQHRRVGGAGRQRQRDHRGGTEPDGETQ